MRRLLLVGIAGLPFLLLQPHPAHALIVECANCADLQDQLLQYAQQAKELATQAQQYATQLMQYQTEAMQYVNMVQNTTALPMSLWSQVQGDIMQVRGLANAASLLTGNSGSIMSRLQSAQGYAGQAMYLPQNIGAQFTMWQQTLGNASNALGRTLGVQQGQEQNNAALQVAIQGHSQSATGQMQAIQAGNELAALTSTQLNQIQTTLTAAAQEQATRDITSADRQASEDAAMQKLVAVTPIEVTGYKGY